MLVLGCGGSGGFVIAFGEGPTDAVGTFTVVLPGTGPAFELGPTGFGGGEALLAVLAVLGT